MSSSLSSSSQPSSATENGKLTRLDRSINVILENPDATPSRKAGITPRDERLHRFHGTSIIFESSRGLSLGTSTNATACTIFHRFYHSASLVEYDVWSVAMASTLLATKVEEDAKNLKQIIEEYTKIYIKRLIMADLSVEESDNGNKNVKQSTKDLVLSSSHVAFLAEPISKWATAKQRQRICADHFPQQLNKFGPVYKECHDRITRMESILLRQLGFTFHWITDSHPHKFLLNFCQVLEFDNKEILQRAWDYCNDSCRLDLSVRYLPEIIASSAILLAARDFNVLLPMKPRPWWKIFIGDENTKGNELVDVANAILGTCNLRVGAANDLKAEEVKVNTSDACIDWLVATKGFVRSRVKTKEEGGSSEKSFNDPDSFLWFYHNDLFEKTMQNQSA